MSTINFLEFKKDCQELADQIKNSGFECEYIVGLARGGWVPTRVLSTFLNQKKILSVGTKYLDTQRKNLAIYSKPDPFPSGCRILIVEDCLESGSSIKLVKELFENSGNIVRTCSVYITPKTKFTPDFYAKKIDQVPKFDWE
jgi:uncharacterized protein